MALGRIYTADSGLVTLASTTQTPLLYWTCSATQTLDILAVRIGIYSGGGVSYPSNGTVEVNIARPTGTKAGGAAVTPNPHNSGDIAAQTTWSSGSTAITGLTYATPVWGQILPFTAGANWAEWVTPGAEWRCAASGQMAIYALCSSAGTATQFYCEAVFAE